MKKKPMSDEKRLAASFVLIVVLSMTLHVLVFSHRKSEEVEHYPVTYPSDSPTPGSVEFMAQGPPVFGKVVVVGTDRYYLQTPTGRQMFFYGDLPHPSLGDNVRVTYAQGTPPTVLKLEKL
jgi:hypothetical protein